MLTYTKMLIYHALKLQKKKKKKGCDYRISCDF